MINSRAPACSHVYPSGWIHTPCSVSKDPVVVDHNERVSALYTKVSTRRTDHIKVEDVLEITYLAKELFTKSSLGDNLASRYLTDTHREFLIDSLNFAVSGHRLISIHSMSRILETHDVGSVLNSSTGELDFTALKDEVEATVSVEELLRQWANQKNGIFDILCTLKHLF